MELCREFFEFVLQTVAYDQNKVIDARGIVELFPGVRHDRTARDLKPELVHIRAHARALAGGDDDG